MSVMQSRSGPFSSALLLALGLVFAAALSGCAMHEKDNMSMTESMQDEGSEGY